MEVSETKGSSPKENAPHKAGHFLFLGGPRRNRTTHSEIIDPDNQVAAPIKACLDCSHNLRPRAMLCSQDSPTKTQQTKLQKPT